MNPDSSQPPSGPLTVRNENEEESSGLDFAQYIEWNMSDQTMFESENVVAAPKIDFDQLHGDGIENALKLRPPSRNHEDPSESQNPESDASDSIGPQQKGQIAPPHPQPVPTQQPQRPELPNSRLLTSSAVRISLGMTLLSALSTKVVQEVVVLTLIVSHNLGCTVFSLLFAGVTLLSVYIGARATQKCCLDNLTCRIYLVCGVSLLLVGAVFSLGVVPANLSESLLLVGVVAVWVLAKITDTCLGATCLIIGYDSVATSNVSTQQKLASGTTLLGHVISTTLAAGIVLGETPSAILITTCFPIGVMALTRTIPWAFPRLYGGSTAAQTVS